MTTQFKDSVILKKSKGEEEVYDLLDVEGEGFFKANDYGFIPNPETFVSACLKGYLMNYIITDSEIILKDLYINSDTNKPVVLNGVEHTLNDNRNFLKAKSFQEFKKAFFSVIYTNIDLKLTQFTGSIILGILRDFEAKTSETTTEISPYIKENYDDFVREGYEKFVKVEFVNGIVEKINIL